MADAKKKTSKKKTKKVTKKKTGGRKALGKNTVVFFMGKLVEAGYLGDEIPEEAKEQTAAVKPLRQMAERLARATLKHGEGDIDMGSEE